MVENSILLILDATSEIKAQVVGEEGGNVFSTADFFIGAIENVGASPERSIDSQTDPISRSVQLLPASRLETTGLLSPPCAAQTDEQASRFVVRGRTGMAPEPDTLLPGQISDLTQNPPRSEEGKGSNRTTRLSRTPGGVGFQDGAPNTRCGAE